MKKLSRRLLKSVDIFAVFMADIVQLSHQVPFGLNLLVAADLGGQACRHCPPYPCFLFNRDHHNQFMDELRSYLKLFSPQQFLFDVCGPNHSVCAILHLDDTSIFVGLTCSCLSWAQHLPPAHSACSWTTSSTWAGRGIPLSPICPKILDRQAVCTGWVRGE